MLKLKKYLWIIISLAVLLSALLWVFFPRSIDSLLIDEKSELSAVAVSVTDSFGDGKTTEYYLSGEELEEFRSLAKKSFVFLNPVKKKWVNSTGMDKSIGIFPEYENRNKDDDVPPYCSIFTNKIITVENKQYYMYGEKFLNGIYGIIGK